jgi:hypothetical protein
LNAFQTLDQVAEDFMGPVAVTAGGSAGENLADVVMIVEGGVAALLTKDPRPIDPLVECGRIEATVRPGAGDEISAFEEVVGVRGPGDGVGARNLVGPFLLLRAEDRSADFNEHLPSDQGCWFKRPRSGREVPVQSVE